ncbi:MAG TPA: 50S ribosomal protein L17 [bacterium]|nr:50S ribosomal protein L17 [bacterium]
MRHRRLRRKLGVRTKHRKALLRNLVRGLVLRKRIQTTLAKAKEASAFADKMVTLAKRNSLHARRLLVQKLGSPDIAKLLIKNVAPQFKDRQGGYTRVLRLGNRVGDGGQMALLEFSTFIEEPEKPKKPKKEKKAKETREIKSQTIEEVPGERIKKEKIKEKEGKPEAPAAKKHEETEAAKETEKKGGFLRTLRKFLTGDDK